MIVRPDFPLRSDTSVPGLAYGAMRMIVLREADEHNLTIPEDSDTGIAVQLAQGLLSFAPMAEGISVSVQAARPEWLQLLRELLMDRLEHAVPDALDRLRWSGAGKAGTLPSNFHFAEILSVTPIGSTFLRVRAKVRDLSGFQDDSIHFPLVLPTAGKTEVDWPVLAENGSTVWPTGDNALHRPVYTVRRIDRSAATLDFDVFLHNGGRATDWVRHVETGTRVGLIGPVGGGVPRTRKILMFADETGFPAVARILETLPRDTIGHVTMFARDGAHCAYPVSAPQGISISWLSHDDGASLADLALTAHRDMPDHFLWLACERAEVLRVRAALKEGNSDPSQCYLSAYWSRS